MIPRWLPCAGLSIGRGRRHHSSGKEREGGKRSHYHLLLPPPHPVYVRGARPFPIFVCFSFPRARGNLEFPAQTIDAKVFGERIRVK